MAKTAEKTTVDPIDAHPFVVEALAGVEDAKKRLEQTRDDIVAGSPVSATDLATARSNVERAELLVERARNEAERDLSQALGREQQREAIRVAAEKPDGNMAKAIAAYDQLVEVIASMWSAAERNTDWVRSMAETVHYMPDAGLSGLSAERGLGIRTPDVVMAATPPAAIVAAALLEVAGPPLPHDTQIGPEARQGLEQLAAQWTKACDYLDRGPSAGPGLSDADERRARSQAGARRRAVYNRAAREQAQANIVRAKED